MWSANRTMVNTMVANIQKPTREETLRRSNSMLAKKRLR